MTRFKAYNVYYSTAEAASCLHQTFRSRTHAWFIYVIVCQPEQIQHRSERYPGTTRMQEDEEYKNNNDDNKNNNNIDDNNNRTRTWKLD